MNKLYSEKPVITVEEGEALLDMTISRYCSNQLIRSEIKAFIQRNYTMNDFIIYKNWIDPVAFEKWLCIK